MGDLQTRIVHACDLTVLTCIDFRLQGSGNLARFLRDEFGNEVRYDLVTVPGACHRLSREGFLEIERVMQDLEMSVSLHAPETIALIQHLQCGRYHKDMRFESEAHEREVLRQDLASAARALRERFPRLEVIGYIARVDDSRALGLDKIFASPV